MLLFIAVQFVEKDIVKIQFVELLALMFYGLTRAGSN